jgi:hypothetical protein
MELDLSKWFMDDDRQRQLGAGTEGAPNQQTTRTTLAAAFSGGRSKGSNQGCCHKVGLANVVPFQPHLELLHNPVDLGFVKTYRRFAILLKIITIFCEPCTSISLFPLSKRQSHDI